MQVEAQVKTNEALKFKGDVIDGSVMQLKGDVIDGNVMQLKGDVIEGNLMNLEGDVIDGKAKKTPSLIELSGQNPDVEVIIFNRKSFNDFQEIDHRYNLKFQSVGNK